MFDSLLALLIFPETLAKSIMLSVFMNWPLIYSILKPIFSFFLISLAFIFRITEVSSLLIFLITSILISRILLVSPLIVKMTLIFFLVRSSFKLFVLCLMHRLLIFKEFDHKILTANFSRENFGGNDCISYRTKSKFPFADFDHRDLNRVRSRKEVSDISHICFRRNLPDH